MPSKNKIFIYLFLILIFFILIVGFKVESVMAAGLNTDYVKITVDHTPAGPPTAHNVFGWAWSDNVGWISFSCDNPEFPDCTNDYGVDINESTGLFSGYAWSDNIGWIDFSPSGPYPTSPDYPACLDLQEISTEPCNGLSGSYKADGWARALNTGAGWDGWIKLRDDAIYTDGVFFNDLTDEFEGWAWSDDFGWISFNCNNPGALECGTSNYKVSAGFIFNTSPTASISCDPSGCHSDPAYQCLGYTGCTFELVNESDDPDPGDFINYTEWDIYGWGSDPDLDCSSKCDFTPSALTSDDYTVELYVEDKNGGSDIATKGFTIYQEAISDFMCSLSGEDGSWQDCATILVSEGEVVYFKDNLLTSSHYSSPSQGATIITERVWEKQEQGKSTWTDFSPPYDFNSSKASTTLAQGLIKIRLTITDNNSVTGPRTVFNGLPLGYITIGIKAPLPEWKEVSPF